MSDNEQGENAGMKALTIEEIAASAFDANERYKKLMAMNQPKRLRRAKRRHSLKLTLLGLRQTSGTTCSCRASGRLPAA